MFSDIYARLLRNIIAQDAEAASHASPFETVNIPPTVQTSTEAFYYLIQSAYERNPHTDLGFVFGKQLVPAHACEFSRMVTTAPTVRHFIQVLIKQYHRLGLKPYPIFFVDKHSACLALTYPYSTHVASSPLGRQNDDDSVKHTKKAQLNRFCSESFYAYVMNVMRDLVSDDFNPDYFALDFSDPGYGEEYEAFFKVPVDFDAGLSLLKFDRRVLDQPLRNSNPGLHQAYLERFAEGWHEARRHQSYRYRAVTQMMQSAPECFQIGCLAEHLNISVRGLQKRLRSENCSFSELTHQVRRELLKICLVRSDMTLDDSAHLLGFHTLSSFKRFFKESLEDKPSATLSARSS